MRIALLKRQIELWLALRCIQAPLLFLFPAGPAAGSIAKRMAEPQMSVVLLAAAIGWLELRRRHESILIGNLGITQTQVAAILIGPGLIAELAIGLLGSI
jgi:hypothetical protein